MCVLTCACNPAFKLNQGALWIPRYRHTAFASLGWKDILSVKSKNFLIWYTEAFRQFLPHNLDHLLCLTNVTPWNEHYPPPPRPFFKVFLAFSRSKKNLNRGRKPWTLTAVFSSLIYFAIYSHTMHFNTSQGLMQTHTHTSVPSAQRCVNHSLLSMYHHLVDNNPHNFNTHCCGLYLKCVVLLIWKRIVFVPRGSHSVSLSQMSCWWKKWIRLRV